MKTQIGFCLVKVLVPEHADGCYVHHLHLGGVAAQALVVGDTLLGGGWKPPNIAAARCEDKTFNFCCVFRIVNI